MADTPQNQPANAPEPALRPPPQVIRCRYFLSYARSDQNDPPPDLDLVRRFHDLLKDALSPSGLAGLDREGFRDREAIDIGYSWADVLLAGLRGCGTFIPLLSMNYFSREFCGKEWAAFETRAGRLPLILPLIWSKRPIEAFPAFANELQNEFAQGLASNDIEEYRNRGLRYLLLNAPNDPRMQGALNALVDRLASKIVERNSLYPLEPHELALLPAAKFPVAFTGAADAAPAARERNIHFGVAAGTRAEMLGRRNGTRRIYPSNFDRDWAPYAPKDYTPISQFAVEAVAGQGLNLSWFDVRGANVVERIRALEKPGEEEPVLLLVDPWAVDVPGLTDRLQEVDRSKFKNCIVVVIWSYVESEDGSVSADATRCLALRTLVRTVFGYTYPSNAEEVAKDFVANVMEPALLRKALEALVRDLTQLVASGRSAMRAIPGGGGALQTVQAQ